LCIRNSKAGLWNRKLDRSHVPHPETTDSEADGDQSAAIEALPEPPGVGEDVVPAAARGHA
jgi:hypothetical protein